MMAKSGLARKLSCSCQDRLPWVPRAKPLMMKALSPKLSCSCQEKAAADVASDPAVAAVGGCSPLVADSAAATVLGSRDFPLATASDFPGRLGDTRRPSQASCGDNRCGADVDTPPDCTRFAGDDKRRVETNCDSKGNGGTGSSRLLRGSLDESMRRIETSSAMQACVDTPGLTQSTCWGRKKGKTNLETAVEFLPPPRRPGAFPSGSLAPA